MVFQEDITNIVIAGAGGQGNLFASRVLAQAAMNKGLEVKVAETYGVALRGGSVHSQIRFGAGEFGPLIPAHGADVLLGLEPLETLRLALDYACPSTVVVSNTHAIAPVQGKATALPYPGADTLAGNFRDLRVKEFVPLDAYSLARDLNDARAMNMIMIGALIGRNAIPLCLNDIDDAVGILSSGEALQKNIAAVRKGFDCTQARNGGSRSPHAC